jgi:hypothetical protein
LEAAKPRKKWQFYVWRKNSNQTSHLLKKAKLHSKGYSRRLGSTAKAERKQRSTSLKEAEENSQKLAFKTANTIAIEGLRVFVIYSLGNSSGNSVQNV